MAKKASKKPSDETRGNAGEWSEYYCLTKLLTEGYIETADENLNVVEGARIIVLGLSRHGDGSELTFRISEDGTFVEVSEDGVPRGTVTKEALALESDRIYGGIKNHKSLPAEEKSSGSFAIEGTRKMMDVLGIPGLKAPSQDKTDLCVTIHDPFTTLEPELRFSVKSYIGGNPTLLNSGDTTNFEYRLTGDAEGALSRIFGAAFVPGDGFTEIKASMEDYEKLEPNGSGLEFVGMNPTFRKNLMMVDSMLPEIVAELMRIRYCSHRMSRLPKLTRELANRGVEGIDPDIGYTFYEYKMKKLLTAIALGMVPGTPWNGTEDANGGSIIIDKFGMPFLYLVYHRGDYEDFLFNHTALDSPSRGKHGYGMIYRVDGEYRVKLNLQIRYTAIR